MQNAPNGAVQRARAVHREVGARVIVAGGILVLPDVAYYGVPVILNVPGLGYVDVPEEEYARLYEKLSSSDSEQLQDAMASLKKLKAAEDAEIEAVQRGPARMEPDEVRTDAGRDLSEPIFFGAPSPREARRRRTARDRNR
jgi:hypothetical protein